MTQQTCLDEAIKEVVGNLSSMLVNATYLRNLMTESAQQWEKQMQENSAALEEARNEIASLNRQIYEMQKAAGGGLSSSADES